MVQGGRVRAPKRLPRRSSLARVRLARPTGRLAYRPVIPQAKITALREALERDGSVTFKNGSKIEFEDCTFCEGKGQRVTEIYGETYERDCPACGTEGVRLLVTRPHCGIAHFRADIDARRAYEMALNGPRPKQQPPKRDFGSVPF